MSAPHPSGLCWNRLEGRLQTLKEGELTSTCVAYSKAQKRRGSLDIADQLQGLHLQERPGDVPLARIQRLFSFRPLGSGHFPQPEKDSFLERLALIPSGMLAGIIGSAVLLCIFFLGKSWVKDL